MDFRIADTFTDSLARLTGEEQKAVKTTAFDLQMNPAQPGHAVPQARRAEGPNFWSVRVSRDIRLIVHRTEASLLLCYVDHHDGAYDWAERRKLETHPKTGAAQFVEIRETGRGRSSFRGTSRRAHRHPSRASRSSPTSPTTTLLATASRRVAGRRARRDRGRRCFDLADHLPRGGRGAAGLATGVTPQPPPTAARPRPIRSSIPTRSAASASSTNVEELERALEYPWEKWTVFLHPAQRQLVERDTAARRGSPVRPAPARRSSRCTGRSFWRARIPMPACCSRRSPRRWRTRSATKLRRLIGNEPRLGERLEVHVARRDRPAALRAELRPAADRHAGGGRASCCKEAAAAGRRPEVHAVTSSATEWDEVVDAWQLDTWEAYRDVRASAGRRGCRRSSGRSLWAIFERVRAGLAGAGPGDLRRTVQPPRRRISRR